jgi:hypothetical protein
MQSNCMRKDNTLNQGPVDPGLPIFRATRFCTEVCVCVCVCCTSTGMSNIKFCTVAPNISSVIIAIFFFAYNKFISSQAQSGERQMTARFTGQSIIVGPQYGACFV